VGEVGGKGDGGSCRTIGAQEFLGGDEKVDNIKIDDPVRRPLLPAITTGKNWKNVKGP